MMKNKFMKYFRSQSKNKRIIMSIGFLLLIALVIYIPFSLAVLTPIKSITITSEHTNYETKEAGSWQVKKSAVWKKKGEAQITFDVDTVIKTNNEATDIILVLDVSSSMNGEKLNRVKNDTVELVNSLLSDSKNRAALITFETESQLVLGLTNDKEGLVNTINGLSTGGTTNYYQALVNVDSILKDYQKEDGRECIVLFLTDGYPNEDIPNQNTYFDYLKDNYPYINVNGIQYEMGSDILDPIKRISDNQYLADMNTLNNVLFDASVAPLIYEDFSITDFINTDYFYVESSNDIKPSQGSVEFDKENQKFTWNIADLKSGSKASITINAKLKEEFIDKGGVYPTNKQEEVKSTIDEDNENVVSDKTPILTDNYKVIYEGNAPDGCSVTGVPNEESYPVFNTVKISDKEPKCEGYQFKGWKVVTKSVKKVNDNHFIMPEEDVIVRATWSRLKISKSMDGEVYTLPTLYRLMASNMKSTDASINVGGNPTVSTSGIYQVYSTRDDEYPVYYYRGIVNNNNVSFGGFCWKMVRTTETGGVKVIYNGVVGSDGSCNNTGTASQIGKSKFNNSSSSPADVGYMYATSLYTYKIKSMPTNDTTKWIYGNDVEWNGSRYILKNTMESSPSNWSSDKSNIGKGYHYTCFSLEDNCSRVSYVYYSGTSSPYYIELSSGKKIEDAVEEMFNSNTTNSTIKTAIDNWYSANMTKYTRLLEDTVWCNDRSMSNSNGWTKDGNANNYLYFGGYGRVGYQSSFKPSLECKREEDRFTVSEKNGNGKLTYPVALLTADELTLAGHGYHQGYTHGGYLRTEERWWVLSPYNIGSSGAYGFNLYIIGSLSDNSLSGSYGVRPAVSLVPGTMVSDGDGTASNPYQIFQNSEDVFR